MKNRTATVFALIIIGGIMWLAICGLPVVFKPGVSAYARAEAEEVPISHVIVVFQGRPIAQSTGAFVQSQVRTLSEYGFETRWMIPTFSMASGEIPSRNVLTISELEKVWGIARDWPTQLPLAPGPQALGSLNLETVREAVGFDVLWEEKSMGENTLVAVVDSGRPDPSVLKVSRSYTLLDDDVDRFGHSTAVCWIYSKLAPNAEIMTVKALGAEGRGRISDVIKALELIANLPEDERPDLVNLSLGIPPTLISPISIAANMLESHFDIPIVAAAGNLGPAESTVMSPGTARETITVGGLGADGTVATFSSRGKQVDLSTYASIISMWGFVETGVTGTSVATPVVGSALLDYYGGLKKEGVSTRNLDEREILKQAVVDAGDPGFDSKYGYGVLDANALGGVDPVFELPWWQSYLTLALVVVNAVGLFGAAVYLLRRKKRG